MKEYKDENIEKNYYDPQTKLMQSKAHLSQSL